MNSQILITFFAALCISSGACGTAMENRVLSPSSSDVMQQKKVTDIVSRVHQPRGVSTWDVKTYKLTEPPSLTSIFFLDANQGWAGGEGCLYKSTNGGASWESLKFDMPPASKVSSIFFLTPSLGWVTLQTSSTNLFELQKNRYWLYQTRDGGSSWQLQNTEEGVAVTKVSFLDEGKGWITGIRYVESRPLRSQYLLMRTSDKGQHLVDVSGELNRIATNEKGFVVGRISDITSLGETSVAILAGPGDIYITRDDGNTWSVVKPVSDEPPQACICRLGRTADNRLWVAGGAFSREGIWGTLAIEQDKDSWTRHRAADVYFADLVLLSDQQAIASGSVPAIKDGRMVRYGVIVHTIDGGLNWDIIYRNEQVESVNSLAAVGNNHVWAIGDGGTFLSLTLKP